MNKVNFCFIYADYTITELAKVKMYNFYHNLELMIEAQEKAGRIIERELGIKWDKNNFGFYCGHVFEMELMGCEVYYPEDDEPVISKPVIITADEIERFTPLLPEENLALQLRIEKSKRFFHLTGKKPTLNMSGPISIAAICRGLNEFYIEAAQNPHWCKRWIEKITDVSIAYKKFYNEQLGIEEEWNSLGDDCCANLSPKLYEELAFPYQLKWYEAFPGKRWMHNCGDTTHILDRIARLELSSFEIGEKVDLKKAKEIFKDTYLGRLFDFKILREGNEDNIKEYTKEQVRIGSSNGNFGIHVEGWKGIPLSKVKIVNQVVDEYNRNQR